MQVTVLAAIADGLSNPEIAQRLGISVNTVMTQLRLTKGRLGANNRTHMMALAYQANILSTPVFKVPSQQARIEYVHHAVDTGRAKRLREMCHDATEAATARACGVAAHTLRRWENDGVMPNGAHLDAYHRVLTHFEYYGELPQKVFTPESNAVDS
jgi:DNA-binding CsgD family transcriptional regulator/DNA-binding XRE family transcriptional regulator